jgi:hypothetical protein
MGTLTKKNGHVNTYLALVVALAALLLTFVMFSHDRQKLLLISFAGSAFYAVWGILHHALEGRINMRIALEYILFSTLSFLLFYLVLSL